MKALLTIIVLSISITIKGQMLLSTNEQFAELKGGYYHQIELLHESDSLYYFFQETYLHTKPVLTIVLKSDFSVLKQIKNPFDLDGQGDYIKIIPLGSKAYICFQRKVEKKHYEIVLKEITPQWINHPTDTVIHDIKSFKDGRWAYQVFNDQLGEYFAIQDIFEKSDGLFRERLVVINKDLEKTFERTYLPQDVRKLNFFNWSGIGDYTFSPNSINHFSDASFDEQGNIYVPGFNGLTIYRKDQQYQKTEYYFPVLGLGPSQWIGYSDFAIREDDIFVSAEFYSNTDIEYMNDGYNTVSKSVLNDTNTIGYFSMIISKKDFDIKKTDFHYLEKNERVPKTTSVEIIGPERRGGLTDRHFETIVLPDSSFLRISERFGNHYFLSFKILTSNISIVKYSKEGEFQWIRYIEKIGSARGTETSEGYSSPVSYQYTQLNGKLYFFYNTTLDPSKPFLRKTKNFIDAELVIVELDPASGTIRKSSQSMFLDGEYVFYPFPLTKTKFGPNLMLLSEGKNKDFKIGTFQLEIESPKGVN